MTDTKIFEEGEIMAEIFIIDEEKIKEELKRSKRNIEKMKESDNSLNRAYRYVKAVETNWVSDGISVVTSPRIQKMYKSIPSDIQNKKIIKKLGEHVTKKEFRFDSLGIWSDVKEVAKAEDPAKEITELIIQKPIMFLWGRTPLGKIPFIREGGEILIEEYTEKYANGLVDRIRRENGVEFRKGDVRRIRGVSPRSVTSNTYAFEGKGTKKNTYKYLPYMEKENQLAKKRKQKLTEEIVKQGKRQIKKISRNSESAKAKKTYTYEQSKTWAQYYRKRAQEERIQRKKAIKKVLGAGKKAVNFIKKFFRSSFVKKHANGGFIYGKTLSYIGEEGPEAVIPLVGNRRRRGLKLWEQTGTKLGVYKSSEGTESAKGYRGEISLLRLLKSQRDQVSEELCAMIADALEGAYKNMPLAV